MKKGKASEITRQRALARAPAAEVPSIPEPEHVISSLRPGIRHFLTRKAKEATTREYRQCLVAMLYLTSARTQKQIAEYILDAYGVEVSVAQIDRDIKDMRTRWRKSAILNTTDATERELAKLDELEAAAIELYETGMVKDFIASMLKIAKRRSCLKGLDKPFKIQSSDNRTSDLSDAELDRILKDNDKEEKEN